ncbi:hypothetical protein MANES_03G074416v8, partial [Manihot esculenta]
LYVFDQNIPDVPDENASDDVKDKYDRHSYDNVQATCVMRIEKYETSKLFSFKMTEGSSVHAHVLKMIGYIKKLARLGFVMDHKLSVGLFIMNFNMHKLDAELSKLVSMLVTAEKCLKKEKKKPKKKKNKKKANTILKPTGGVKKDKGTCHHCGIEGDWRRNSKVYLATMKARKLGEASTSGTKK